MAPMPARHDTPCQPNRARSVLGRQNDMDDEGPLLLSSVQGIEGVSMPYAYDVVMYREPDAGDIDPKRTITVQVAYQQALDSQSMCNCMWAGVITITDPGQQTTEIP